MAVSIGWVSTVFSTIGSNPAVWNEPDYLIYFFEK